MKCFMNGKSCVYERFINPAHDPRDTGNLAKKAFIIMPFNKKLDALYEWVVYPYLRNGGPEGAPIESSKYAPERADDIHNVGYIMCEKICKKIQEADLVVCDVSYSNANVFYELGLSVALRKKILPLCLEENWTKRKRHLEKMGISKVLEYERFKEINKSISDYFLSFDKFANYEKFEQVDAKRIRVLSFGREPAGALPQAIEKVENFNYEFGSLCRQAVKHAVASLSGKDNARSKSPPLAQYYSEEEIEAFRDVEPVDLRSANCEEVIQKLKDAACVLVDITESNDLNFFWLGYIHGIGANAIPINIIPSSSEIASREDRSNRIVPFDLRALWHIAFEENNPKDLATSLTDILEFIYLEKAKYRNREKFWRNIIADSEVSIFLGSRFLENLERNAIGDWDYRTAAEIAAYLSAQKESIKVTLESPIAWQEKINESERERYVGWLRNQLKGKNCIIVASADVNDLTEVALCDIFSSHNYFVTSDGKIHKQEPFTKIDDFEYGFRGYIAFKEYSQKYHSDSQGKTNAFYIRNNGEEDRRGFIVRQGTSLTEITEHHAYPNRDDRGLKVLLGQLVVADNPCAPGKSIIVISGISGPATLGIAQMLTGCVYSEFTTNSLDVEKPSGTDSSAAEKVLIAIEEFKKKCLKGQKSIADSGYQIPHATLSEDLLRSLTDDGNRRECNAIISVGVFYPGRSAITTGYSNDERKIIGWNFANLDEFLHVKWQNPSGLGLEASHEVSRIHAAPPAI